MPVRVAVVLSAGGLRGAAHAGVLRQLVRHGIRIDAIVGVSAGAVVAAYYAAVGLDVEELVWDAAMFRGRHLLLHSLNVRLAYRLERRLGPRCGVIPERLRQLEDAPRGLAMAGRDGEGAVTPGALRRIHGWFEDGVPIAAAG